MFKINNNKSYPWPVAGQLAGHTYKFEGSFAYLDQQRIDEIMVGSARREALLKNGEDDSEYSGFSHLTIAHEVLVGWNKEVVDDDGNAIEYSDDAKDKLLQIQGVARAVATAWAESLNAGQDAPQENKRSAQGGKRGNSKASRGIG